MKCKFKSNRICHIHVAVPHKPLSPISKVRDRDASIARASPPCRGGLARVLPGPRSLGSAGSLLPAARAPCRGTRRGRGPPGPASLDPPFRVAGGAGRARTGWLRCQWLSPAFGRALVRASAGWCDQRAKDLSISSVRVHRLCQCAIRPCASPPGPSFRKWNLVRLSYHPESVSRGDLM